jgi:hypothetical protein
MNQASPKPSVPIAPGLKTYLYVELCFWIVFAAFSFPVVGLVFWLVLILAGFGWYIFRAILFFASRLSSNAALSQHKAEAVRPRGVWDRELDD